MSQHEDRALPRRAITAAVVTSLIPVAGQAATAARVDFTVGDVIRVDKDGKERRLRKGSVVNGGDTVRTDARGRAQLRFTDGSRTALLPNTEFRVDDYRFDGQEDENSRSFFSLLKGGLRTISGAIGKLRRKSYKVQTPVATIGIRGTEYLIVLGNSSEMYVGSGGVVSENEAGTFFCSGFCYVPDSRSPMVVVEGQPFYSAPPPDKPKGSEGAGTSGDPAGDTINVTFGDPLADSGPATQPRNLEGDRFTVGVAVQDGVTTKAFVAGAGELSKVSFGTPLVPGTPNTIEKYQADDSDNTSAALAGASAIEVGTAGPATGAAVVGWSRWVQGDYMAQGSVYGTGGCGSGPCDSETRTLQDPESHHLYAIIPPTADEATALAGKNLLFTYGLAGLTTPTTSNQPITPGTDKVLGGTLTFNTQSYKVQISDMRVVAGNGTYDVTLNSNAMGGVNGSSNFTFAGSSSDVTDNSTGQTFSYSGRSVTFAGGISTGFTNAAAAYKATDGMTDITGVTAWQQTSEGPAPPPAD